MKKTFKYTLYTCLISPLLFSYFLLSPSYFTKNSYKKKKEYNPIAGADQISKYQHLIKGKKIGIVANQSSIINGEHLVDILLEDLNIDIQYIFSPEHGFRGLADAGEKINNKIDLKTGLTVTSLYGARKKPSAHELKNIDVMVFDLQDVGVRTYTYLSTLTYIMEVCSDQDIPLILLDRPNPNGHYIDGPVLDLKFKSFFGLHPVPLVYGMTIGEYAKMILGEKWLQTKKPSSLDLTVIPIKNYDRKQPYFLKIKPSPNLPNNKAIRLFPSLCFFEGTQISVGKGTPFPFQVYGSPFLPHKKYNFSFIPMPDIGAKNPAFNEKTCYGKDLRKQEENKTLLKQINLKWLINAYKNFPHPSTFFNSHRSIINNEKEKPYGGFFNKLSGSDKLKNQIERGLSEEQIRASWKKQIDEFKKIRKRYLIYEDF